MCGSTACVEVKVTPFPSGSSRGRERESESSNRISGETKKKPSPAQLREQQEPNSLGQDLSGQGWSGPDQERYERCRASLADVLVGPLLEESYCSNRPLLPKP